VLEYGSDVCLIVLATQTQKHPGLILLHQKLLELNMSRV